MKFKQHRARILKNNLPFHILTTYDFEKKKKKKKKKKRKKKGHGHQRRKNVVIKKEEKRGHGHQTLESEKYNYIKARKTSLAVTVYRKRPTSRFLSSQEMCQLFTSITAERSCTDQ